MFRPLRSLLPQAAPGLQDRQAQFSRLCQGWEAIAPPRCLAFTRPYGYEGGVLWIATANNAWAQQLTLQRPRLQGQLSNHLGEPLRELRFSEQLWHRFAQKAAVAPASVHPSRLLPNLAPPPPPAMRPDHACAQWLQSVQARSHQMRSCPRCTTPAPPGELERWGQCMYCMQKHWQKRQESGDPAPNPPKESDTLEGVPILNESENLSL